MKVSVIVPCHNEARHIQNCLKALQNQSVPCEVIVVDDASSDQTPSMVKQFKKVKFFRQSKKGPAAARNLGAQKAKGAILVFTDADCVPEKNFVEEMLRLFEDEEVVGVQGAYKTLQKNWMARFCQIEIEERYEKMKKSANIDFVSTYAAAYRKKEFFQEKGFDERYPTASGEDTDLSYALSEKGKKLVFAPDAIVYHIHPESLIQYLKTKFYRGYWRVRLYSKHQKKVVQDSYTTQWLKVQIILAALLLVSLAIWPWNPSLWIAFLVFYVMACYPSFLFYAKRDQWIALHVFLVQPLRGYAFLFGLLYGYAKGVAK